MTLLTFTLLFTAPIVLMLLAGAWGLAAWALEDFRDWLRGGRPRPRLLRYWRFYS